MRSVLTTPRTRAEGEEDRAAVAKAVTSPRRWLADVAVFAAFGLAVVYATWPLVPDAATRVPLSAIDPFLNVWLYAWAAHAIIHAPFDLFDANMFFPESHTLAFTENDLGQSLPVAPLYWLTGNGILTVNVALILMYTVSAFGAYLLARELGATRTASFLAGIVFGLAPYRISQMAHVHVVALHIAPFVLLFLVRLRRAPSRRLVLGVALTLAFQFWASLSAGAITLAAIGAWGLWEVASDRRASWPVLVAAGKGVLLGLVLVAPLAVPYLEARRAHPEYTHAPEEVYTYSATLKSYLRPPAGGSLVSASYEWLGRQTALEPGAWEKQLFPGWTMTGTVLVAGTAGLAGAVRARRTKAAGRPTGAALGVAIAVTGFVLSLGPRFGADPNGFPLPFDVIARMTPLLRVPARFGSLVPLGVGLAVALALSRLAARRRHWLVALMAIALLVELTPSSVSMLPAPEMTSAHRAVAGRPGAVLALPTAETLPDGSVRGFVENEPVHAYLSTAHFRPLVNGYSAFQPASWWEMIHAVQDFPSEASLEFLQDRGVETVVIETDRTAGTQWEDSAERLAQWPGSRRIAKDEGTSVYDISGVTLRR